MAVMNGVVMGTVVDVLDPVMKGRLRLRLSSVAGGDSWAPSCAKGVRVGDTVVVAFENGDANYPVVIGKVGG